MRRYIHMRQLALLAAMVTLALAPPAAAAPTITEFPLPTPEAGPFGITAGPDGALWFTEWTAGKIGRITADGVVTEYPLPMPWSQPMGITVGPDGALWFTERYTDKIGRITTDGAITEFAIPPPPTRPRRSEPRGITAGPDGALWFTASESKKIGRITTGGDITQFPLPPLSRDPMFITAGPDGALWFTVNIDRKIGRITTDGSLSEFQVPTPHSLPIGITTGPDGALWFAGGGADKIGRITTSGALTQFPLPTQNRVPYAITTGPDGALWFTELEGGIGRITTAGDITEYPLPVPYGSTPHGIAAGPDGALWFTESSANLIGRVTVPLDRTETEVNCSPATVVAGAETACTATVSDSEPEIATTPGGTVDFTTNGDGGFSGTGSCALTEAPQGVASCQVAYRPGATESDPVRRDQITATYEGDATHAHSNGSADVAVLSIELLRRGAFVIGDRNSDLDASVTFWGARWQQLNDLSGNSVVPSFMGFASRVEGNPPECGGGWIGSTGASSEPPSSVPKLMAVIASSSISKGGRSIMGDSSKVVVVRTNSDYGSGVGDAGTGTVVGVVCGG